MGLVRLFVILVLFYLIYRMLDSLGLMGRGKKKPEAGGRRNLVKDPVCGLNLPPDMALRLENGDAYVYFCSEGCRQKYLKKSVQSDKQ